MEVAEGVRQGGRLRMEILSRGLPESQKACKACLPGSPTLPGAETGRTAVPSLCVGWSESTTMLCAQDKKYGVGPLQGPGRVLMVSSQGRLADLASHRRALRAFPPALWKLLLLLLSHVSRVRLCATP